MSYSDKFISEVLNSVKKIGIAKTARLFNVYRSTIYGWQKQNIFTNSEKSLKKNDLSTFSRLLVMQRMKISNTKIQGYLYNIKDLHTGLEFNGFALENNTHTPVAFLEYILSFYLKSTKIKSFTVNLKGYAKNCNINKYSSIRDCKLEIIHAESRHCIESFNKKEISTLCDTESLLNFLTVTQLEHNLINNDAGVLGLRFILPINLDNCYNNPSEMKSSAQVVQLESATELMLEKTEIQLREGDYSNLEKPLKILNLVISEIKNPEKYIKYYDIQINCFSLQGNIKRALDFLQTQFKMSPENRDVQFFILLKICGILLNNYNVKNFDYYFKKCCIIYDIHYHADLLIDFDLLTSKRESLYLPVEESVMLYISILHEYKKGLSGAKKFEIYLKISNLYKNISDFKNAHLFLEKAYKIVFKNNDSYLLCAYYEAMCELLLKKGNIDEASKNSDMLEQISLKHNYTHYYYSSKELLAFNHICHGKYDLALIEIEKVDNYGEISNNSFIKLKSSRIYQKYYIKTGDYSKALKYNQKEIDIAGMLMDIYSETVAINNRCSILAKNAINDEILFWIECLNKKNKILKDPSMETRIYLYHAYFEHKINKSNIGALEFYKKALKSAKKNRIYHLLFLTYSHIAIIQRTLKMFKAAIRNINESIFYYRRNDLLYDLPRLYYIKAKTYQESGNIVKAKSVLKEVFDLCKENNTYYHNECLKLAKVLEEQYL